MATTNGPNPPGRGRAEWPPTKNEGRMERRNEVTTNPTNLTNRSDADATGRASSLRSDTGNEKPQPLVP